MSALQKPYSDETAGMIDDEVRNLVNSQYARAQRLLLDKRHELELLAQKLLEKEVLLKSDVERLIGLRPYPEDKLSQNGIPLPPVPSVEATVEI